MGGDGHDGSGAVGGEDVVGDEDGDLLAGDGVHAPDAVQADAGLLLVELSALQVALGGGGALVVLDLGGVFQQGHPLFDEVVLRGEDHVGGAEEGVGAGGEDDDVVAGGGFEGDFGAGGAADPVFLLGLDAVDEVQVVQVVDEALGVLGDLEHPLALLLADNGAAAALTDALDNLLVCQYALAGGTPVDGHGGLVGQTLLVELEKNPLGPFVVFRVGGVHDAVPVKAEAQHFELFGEMGDVVFGDHGGMDVVFDGVVLGGEAEGIEAHGEKDVVAVHALFAGDDVHGGVGRGWPTWRP